MNMHGPSIKDEMTQTRLSVQEEMRMVLKKHLAEMTREGII